MKSTTLCKLTLFVLCLAVCLGLTVSAEADVLRFGKIGQMVRTMDPNNMYQVSVSYPIKNQIFEGLIRLVRGSGEVEPWLAERYDLSKDGKEITFYLRKGVQFHGGYGELTAEDVKATIGRYFEAEKWGLLQKETLIPPLERIEVVDRYTVKFHLSEPNYTLFFAALPIEMGWVSSKKALDELGPKGVLTKAIGTGPYTLEEWTPNRIIKLKKFDKYWGNKPYYDEVHFISFGSYQAAELALKAGEVDATTINPEDMKMLKEDKNLEVKVWPQPGYCWIGFDVKLKPVDDIRVRKAIRLAVNVDDILRAKRGDSYDDPTKLRANSMMSPSSIGGYWKDAPVYQPDLEKAKSLLKEAGYPNGFSIECAAPLYKGGEPIVGQMVQQQLKKIGIKVILPVIEHSAFWEEHLPRDGKFPMFVDTWSMGPFPEQNLIWFKCDQRGQWNMMQWCNPEFDRLLSEATKQPDAEKRHELYIKAQKLMDDDAIAIWLEWPVYGSAWRKSIQGVFNPMGWEQVQLMRPNK